MPSPKSPKSRKAKSSRKAPPKTSDVAHQPLSRVQWVPRESLQPNNYNPNKMAPPERELLIVSIVSDGWTQPIVIYRLNAVAIEIVDGFHRWNVSDDPRVMALTGGLVPIVELPASADREHRMMSTIRHNRARGAHGVLPMAEIVRALIEAGKSPEDIQELLQMEDEEVERLAERAGMPIVIARRHDTFNKGWEPG